MKVIKEIVERINEEIVGAEDYAKSGTQYKDEDKMLADTYIKLAEVELQHVDLLHAQVVRIIKAWQAKGNEAPPAMEAVWDYVHANQVDKVARIKVLINMYYGK